MGLKTAHGSGPRKPCSRALNRESHESCTLLDCFQALIPDEISSDLPARPIGTSFAISAYARSSPTDDVGGDLRIDKSGIHCVHANVREGFVHSLNPLFVRHLNVFNFDVLARRYSPLDS
jgi:hypothetical protein